MLQPIKWKEEKQGISGTLNQNSAIPECKQDAQAWNARFHAKMDRVECLYTTISVENDVQLRLEGLNRSKTIFLPSKTDWNDGSLLNITCSSVEWRKPTAHWLFESAMILNYMFKFLQSVMMKSLEHGLLNRLPPAFNSSGESETTWSYCNIQYDSFTVIGS